MASLFYDEELTRKFVERLREANSEQGSDVPDAYYFQIMTREKYGSFTNQILFRKLVSLSRLVDEIHQATPFRGFYIEGRKVPHESLVCYMTPEPRDIERAGKQVCASFILKAEDQKFAIPSAFLSECQKNPASRRILDVDVDVKDKFPAVMAGVEKAGIKPRFIIDSRGGYHILCYDCTGKESKALYDLSQEVGDIDMLKNAMVPIPGTLQGGVPVRLLF